MSTYGIEELGWILVSDLNRCHCHAFFLLKGNVEFSGVLQVLFIELTPGTSIRIQDTFPECHPNSRYDQAMRLCHHYRTENSDQPFGRLPILLQQVEGIISPSSTAIGMSGAFCLRDPSGRDLMQHMTGL